MSFDINSELMQDALHISLNKSISTLESNYYINKVCLSYSKLQCLSTICDEFINNNNTMLKIYEYKLGSQRRIQHNIKYIDFNHNETSEKWLNMFNNEDMQFFFKQFNTFKMPLVFINKIYYEHRHIANINLPSQNVFFHKTIFGKNAEKSTMKDFNCMSIRKKIERNPTVPIKTVYTKKNGKHPIQIKNIKGKVSYRIKKIRKKRKFALQIETKYIKEFVNHLNLRKRNPTVSVKTVNTKRNNIHPICAKDIKRKTNCRVIELRKKRSVSPQIKKIFPTFVAHTISPCFWDNNVNGTETKLSEHILAHDYDTDALKIITMKHFSPPEYVVKALENILNYLITNKREEELHKIKMCIQQQEYIYKDLAILEKIVSISKVLQDKDIPDGIKIHVLNTLQIILYEQEELHKKMGISPTITHIDLLA